MSATRIYIVTTPQGENLVEAINPSQAVKAVTHAGVTVAAASSKDVARLLGAGKTLISVAAVEAVAEAVPA